METKVCSKCNDAIPLFEFDLSSYVRKSDGKRGFCAECNPCKLLRRRKKREHAKPERRMSDEEASKLDGRTVYCGDVRVPRPDRSIIWDEPGKEDAVERQIKEA